MIDVAKLYHFKPSFGFFALQLMYPEKLDFHPDFLEESFEPEHPAYTHAHTFWSQMQELSIEQIQELYTETFDFQKDCALYMTYFKYEDSKERGQMLTKLKMLYELYGLKMPDGELPDYLPLMCEFFYAAEWRQDPKTPENFRMPVVILEDGTYYLAKALEKKGNPYFHLVKGLRETLKACVVGQEQEAAIQ